MTVLQFSTMVPPAGFGGAERVVAWLTEELEAAGLSVHNSGLRAREDEQTAHTHSIRNIYWPFDGVARGVIQRSTWHLVDTLLHTARRQVEDIFDEVDPSVVVTHNLRGWGFAPWVVARSRGVPLIQVVHDYGLICNTGTLWRNGPCERLCAPCTLRRGASQRHWPGGQVVGVSRAVLDTNAAYGLDFAREGSVSYPLAAAATAVRPLASRGEAPLRRTLGFLGRLAPAKGVETLLSAMKGSSHELLIAGSGDQSYLDSLGDNAPENVRWLGWVEPTSFLRGIDVLVVPSAWPEPFGLVVVEAAEAGVPVLIADHPGLVEAAQASKARYRTFASANVAALGEALDLPLTSYRVQQVVTEPVDLVKLITDAVSEQEGAGAQRFPTLPPSTAS